MHDLDMRKEFVDLLKDYGRTVLYRRSSRQVPCVCYSSIHRSGDPGCEVCDGSGKMVEFQKAQIIDQSRGQSGPEDTSIGRLDQKERTVWFRHDFYPRVGDMYYQVGWKGNFPVSLHNVYEVVAVQEVTGDKGRIEHHEVVIKGRPDMVPKAKGTLKRILGREIEVI